MNWSGTLVDDEPAHAQLYARLSVVHDAYETMVCEGEGQEHAALERHDLRADRNNTLHESLTNAGALHAELQWMTLKWYISMQSPLL